MKKYLLFLTLFAFAVTASDQSPDTQAIDESFKAWDKPDVPRAAIGVIVAISG